MISLGGTHKGITHAPPKMQYVDITHVIQAHCNGSKLDHVITYSANEQFIQLRCELKMYVY